MYPVDLHMYTVASTHVYSTLSNYITEAHRKDIKLFVITDHGSDMMDMLHHWRFTSMRIWPRAMNGVGILRRVKANIKNIKGEIGCSDSMFTSLDLIIAGFHESAFTPHDKDTNTQAMIATMAGGSMHIISHPEGPKYPVDIKAVTRAAAKYQITLEINNSSSLHSCKSGGDNCHAVAAATRDIGGWVVLGSGLHTVFMLGEFGECRKTLDDTNFPEDRILSVTPKRLLTFPESRGMESIAGFTELQLLLTGIYQ